MARQNSKRNKPAASRNATHWHPPSTALPATNTLPRLFRRQSRWAWHALLLLVLSFQPALLRAQTSAQEAVDPGQVQSGSLLLRMANGYYAATALDTNVTMRINGLVARVSVRQAFANTGSEWAEGVYVFPLPDKAAVDQMRLHIGERFIEGEIREKEQARKEYEQARAAGKKASLVEQQRPNLFTTSVANIAPGETVVVEIEYLEDLRYTDGLFSLRFPMTLTPRYMPGAPLPDRQGSGWSADTSQVDDASLISPPMVGHSAHHRMTLEIDLNAGMPLDLIASRYHPVTVTENQGRYRIDLTDTTVPMDHDFELTWKPVALAAPRALAFTETVDDEPYYLLMVMPPAASNDQALLMPREMIFIIDTSGSMHGTSLAQAKKALQRALQGLRPIDRFNVVAFNSRTTPLFTESQPVDTRTLELAGQFVGALQAEGGTEMRGALEFSLQRAASESHLRQMIFITDGAVGNEEELFSLIERGLGQGRLFTVGIGSAPNSWFMRKAAEVGRGTFTMISALNEVGEKMDRLFSKIEQPQVTNIEVAWPASMVASAYPSTVPDLYANEPVIVKARLTGTPGNSDTVRISGNTMQGAWHDEIVLKPTGDNEAGVTRAQANSAGIATLWARARIASLFDDARRGRDPVEVRAEVVETALTHHLVSKYTSLVAVDKTPARPAGDPLRKDQVPNLLPYGQSANAIFGFPNTATNAAQLMQTGCLFLLLAITLLLLGRRQRHAAAA